MKRCWLLLMLICCLPEGLAAQEVKEISLEKLLNLVVAVAEAVTESPDSVAVPDTTVQQGGAIPSADVPDRIVEHRQQSFPLQVPAGNYSGITWIGGNCYAVVDDKAPTSGFYVFQIAIDSLTGQLTDVHSEGFISSQQPNRDEEGIAYHPQRGTLFISGEADNEVLEYRMDGAMTGQKLQVPACFKTASKNYGLESLTYNAVTHRFWTTTESTLAQDGEQATSANGVNNLLRLQSFGEDLQPAEQYFYEMDAPSTRKQAANYALGVSELCALDDGRLIVMEREFFVPQAKLGAFVVNKLYVVNPAQQSVGEKLQKSLLLRIKTNITLLSYGIANYEGICLGPRLADGRQVLVMVSDSQAQYKGILQDWFKTIVLP